MVSLDVAVAAASKFVAAKTVGAEIWIGLGVESPTSCHVMRGTAASPLESRRV